MHKSSFLIDISDDPRQESDKTGPRPLCLVGNFPFMPQSLALTRSTSLYGGDDLDLENVDNLLRL